MHFKRMANNPEYRETFFAMMGARGYKAATSGQNQTPFMQSGGSADSEILGGSTAMRNRVRELNRDDPIASGLTDSFVNNIIGKGIITQSRTGDQSKDERIESVWNDLKDNLYPADDLNFEESQSLHIRKLMEDGEIFIKRSKSSANSPTFYENIEADRIEAPAFIKPKDKLGSIRGGIERDKFDRIVAYHVNKKHPGALVNSIIPVQSKDQFQRVLKDNMIHLRELERPGQSRGVSRFHAVIQDLRDLDLLILASLKRVQIAALFAAFITSDSNLEDMMEVTSENFGFRMDQDIEPGMMWKLYPGEDIKTLVPNFPTPDFVPFIIMLARRIGAAFSVSWQVVLKDFSQANYSSARTDLGESRQIYTIMQKLYICRVLKIIRRWSLQDAQLRGDSRLAGILPEDLAKVNFIPPGWRFIDPQKEARAQEIELDSGTTTLRDIAATKGQDWEDIQDQRLREEKREIEKRAEMGLPEKNPEPEIPEENPQSRMIEELQDEIERLEDAQNNRVA